MMKKNRQEEKQSMVGHSKPVASEELIKSSMATLPEYLQQRTVPVWFKNGQIVIKKDEDTQFAYLLLAGDLIVLNEFRSGNYYSFAHIWPGRYISDLEVLSGKMINAVTLMAIEDSFALQFKLDDFIYCMDTDLNFFRAIVRGMAAAMFDTSSERGQNLYSLGINKLVRYLVRYCNHYQQSKESPVVVKLTRQAIASEIGINEKTVNRGIMILKNDGFIDVVKGKVQISPQQQQILIQRINEVNQ